MSSSGELARLELGIEERAPHSRRSPALEVACTFGSDPELNGFHPAAVSGRAQPEDHGRAAEAGLDDTSRNRADEEIECLLSA